MNNVQSLFSLSLSLSLRTLASKFLLELFSETLSFTCASTITSVSVILTRTQSLLLPWDLLQMFLSHVHLLKPEPWLPYQSHFQCLARKKEFCIHLHKRRGYTVWPCIYMVTKTTIRLAKHVLGKAEHTGTGGVLGPGFWGHPPARKARRRVHKTPGPRTPPHVPVCKISGCKISSFALELFYIE